MVELEGLKLNVDPESLPLRDRLRDAEKLVRDLSEHLNLSYLSRTRELERMTAEGAAPVGDMSVRLGVYKAVEAHGTTVAKWQDVLRYLNSIQSAMNDVGEES